MTAREKAVESLRIWHQKSNEISKAMKELDWSDDALQKLDEFRREESVARYIAMMDLWSLSDISPWEVSGKESEVSNG